MTRPFTSSRSTLLARDELVVLDDAQGVTLTLDYGVVWLTLQHDSRDVVLGAGERFRIDRPGRTVMMAHVPASVRIEIPKRYVTLRRFGNAVLRGVRRRLLDMQPRRVPYF